MLEAGATGQNVCIGVLMTVTTQSRSSGTVARAASPLFVALQTYVIINNRGTTVEVCDLNT